MIDIIPFSIGLVIAIVATVVIIAWFWGGLGDE